MAAAKKQAVKIIPPETGYPGFARFRTPVVKALLKSGTFLGVGAFSASFAWFYYLLWSSPHKPSPTTGQVVQLSNHGDLFFTRGFEALTHELLSTGGFLLLAACSAADFSIFGSQREQTSGRGRFLGWVFGVVLVLVLAMVATAGRFPFAMASPR